MKLRYLPILLMFIIMIAAAIKINTAQVSQPATTAVIKTTKIVDVTSAQYNSDQEKLKDTLNRDRDNLNILFSNQREFINLFMIAAGLIIALLAYFGITNIGRVEKDAEKLEKTIKESIQEAKEKSKEIQDHCKQAEAIVSDAKKKADEMLKEMDNKFNEFKSMAKITFEEMDRKFNEFISTKGKEFDEILKMKMAVKGSDVANSDVVLSSVPEKVSEDTVKNITSAPTAEKSAAYYFRKASKTQNYDEQIRYLNKVIEIKPDYANAYLNRSSANINIHEYDLAIKDCDKAISLNPNDKMAYNNRAYANTLKGLYDLAIKDFNKAINLDPNYLRAYGNRAYANTLKGLYDLAIKDWERVLILGSDNAIAYYNLSCVLSIRNKDVDIEKAILMFELAAKKGFNNIELAEKDKDLDNLRSHPKFADILKRIEENAK